MGTTTVLTDYCLVLYPPWWWSGFCWMPVVNHNTCIKFHDSSRGILCRYCAPHNDIQVIGLLVPSCARTSLYHHFIWLRSRRLQFRVFCWCSQSVSEIDWTRSRLRCCCSGVLMWSHAMLTNKMPLVAVAVDSIQTDSSRWYLVFKKIGSVGDIGRWPGLPSGGDDGTQHDLDCNGETSHQVITFC